MSQADRLLAPDLPPGPTAGKGGLPRLQLRGEGGAEADVYLHGAHVTRWVPAGERTSRLFLSDRAHFAPAAAIRGGIPVIFPQFAQQGSLQKHGFARLSPWSLVRVGPAKNGGCRAELRLVDTDGTREQWPHTFSADLAVTIGGAMLQVELSVANPGTAPFSFNATLHSYLSVGDIAAATVTGLRGSRYLDSAAGGVERVEERASLAIVGEVDRIFLDVRTDLELREPGPTLHIAQTGFRDVVVWNPGSGSASRFPDLAPGDAARMVCIEAAAVGTPVTLAPGGCWTASQTLTAIR